MTVSIANRISAADQISVKKFFKNIGIGFKRSYPLVSIVECNKHYSAAKFLFSSFQG